MIPQTALDPNKHAIFSCKTINTEVTGIMTSSLRHQQFRKRSASAETFIA